MRCYLFWAAALLVAAPVEAAVLPSRSVPIAVDPFAHLVKAGGWVDGADGREYIELLVDGDDAALRTSKPGAARPKYQALTLPSDVLLLLADRRLEFLWAPLTEWTGPSLERLRARIIRRARYAAETARPDRPPSDTSQSTVRPRIRAILQYARVLDVTGNGVEAERMLAEQLAGMRFKQGSNWQGIEWFSVASAIAWSRAQRDDRVGAIAQYVAMERTMGSSPYAVNATVNRAAALAMDGQYGAALQAIDQGWATYLKDNRGDKIPGSDRQFSWIRACALHGLGRKAEAEAALRILRDDREVTDDVFITEPDNDLKIRSAACMRDGKELARLIGRDFRRVGRSPALLLLQPGYIARGANLPIIVAVRSDPDLKAAAATRMRVLPPEMTAALNGWR